MVRSLSSGDDDYEGEVVGADFVCAFEGFFNCMFCTPRLFAEQLDDLGGVAPVFLDICEVFSHNRREILMSIL